MTRVVCPPEVTAALPAAIAAVAGAIVKFNAAGQAWLDAHFAREGLLADRLSDAAAQCPR